MKTLFFGGRKLDADGEVADFWMLTGGDSIIDTGTGAAPRVAADERVDLGGDWLVPGFIDLHCHGGGGHAFDGDSAAIRDALATHRAHGTTRSVLSLVANPITELAASLDLIADLAADDPTVLGSHLEGPFLSPHRRGAHDERHLIDPTRDVVAELIDAARGTLRYVTLAPELDGALDAIEQLRASGAAVGVGHTDADRALTRDAFARGATVLTHAFNAMPGIHHRDPGPVVTAIMDDRITLELVLDGVHVHPAVAAMTFRAAPHRVALITDAMAAAGAGDGDYRLGALDVVVDRGRAVLAGSGAGTIAGSTLTQDRALRNAIELAQVSPRDAIAALTLAPARALALSDRLGRLTTGYSADAVRLDREWNVTDVWVAGARLSSA